MKHNSFTTWKVQMNIYIEPVYVGIVVFELPRVRQQRQRYNHSGSLIRIARAVSFRLRSSRLALVTSFNVDVGLRTRP